MAETDDCSAKPELEPPEGYWDLRAMPRRFVNQAVRKLAQFCVKLTSVECFELDSTT